MSERTFVLAEEVPRFSNNVRTFIASRNPRKNIKMSRWGRATYEMPDLVSCKTLMTPHSPTVYEGTSLAIFLPSVCIVFEALLHNNQSYTGANEFDNE